MKKEEEDDSQLTEQREQREAGVVSLSNPSLDYCRLAACGELGRTMTEEDNSQLKALETVGEQQRKQLWSYLRLMNCPFGMLILRPRRVYGELVALGFAALCFGL